MIKLKDILKESSIIEGVNDPGILKAVFLAGGPGSGKSTVANELFGMTKSGFSVGGLKNVNSDRFFEFMLQKKNLTADLASLSQDEFISITSGPDSPRVRAKSMFQNAYSLYLGGRLGMLIDGTGDDIQKVIDHAEKLKNEFGYDVSMIFVNTPLEKALERNDNRDRKLPHDLVTNSWNDAQKAKEAYQRYFGKDFKEVINDKDAAPGQPVSIDKDVYAFATKFMDSPIKNPVGLAWINKSREANKLNEADETYKIFCDMDGVLADFPAQWKKYFEEEPKTHKKRVGKEEFDMLLDTTPYKFWFDMGWMPGGEKLWSVIKKYDTTILSSPAESEDCKKAKADWLKKHGINNKLILKKSYRKQEHAAPNHILIDDYIRNIEQWRAKGGIAIHHTDINKTLAELAKYGIK
jgi:predicted kinase